MVNIRRTCLVLLILLLLTGCQRSPGETQNLEKFYDYVSFYDFLYGSNEAGNFKQMITHFYNTFYPDNEMNVNVSVYQLSGIEKRVQGELERLEKAIEKEPAYEDLDEKSKRIHDDLSKIFSNMKELSALVNENQEQVSEKEVLFQETDGLIIDLNQELGLWLTSLKEVQTQYELSRLQSFDNTSDQLSFLFLDTIMRSESILIDMRTLLREGETDLVRVKENTTKIKEYETPIQNYAKDAKQLISSGLSSDEVLLFLEHLKSFAEQSEGIISRGIVDGGEYANLENTFTGLLELYNNK